MKGAIEIIKTLQNNGHHALLVGGCVRDKIMGVVPHDYDIVTSAFPEQVEALFEDTKPIGKCFGVILVNHDYEVATFRVDRYVEDNKLSVTLLRHNRHSLEELVKLDSNKRDLKINSCYYDPISDKYYDPQEGVKSIKNKDLSFVGRMHKRIQEDPIRLLRALRFAVTYNWEVDERITDIDLIMEINDIPKERIYTEVTKILMNMNTWDIDLFSDLLSILGFDLFPQLESWWMIEQPPQHHTEGSLLHHTFYALKALRVKTPVTVWATLLHDVGKVTETKIDTEGKITSHGHDEAGAIIAEKMLKDLKCSNKFIDEVVYIIRNHMRIKLAPTMKKAKTIKLIKNNYYENLLEVSCADSMGAKGNIDWYHWIKEFALSDNNPKEDKITPLVTGKDLIELGFEPGETFKVLLGICLDNQLNDHNLTKEDIIQEMLEENPIC